MSDWADEILAESSMPSDDFTFTDGSNHGMDGFQFDSEENEGVLQGARLPETKGLAKLPDGFVTAYVPDARDEVSLEDKIGGLQLGAFLEETAIEETMSLADLDWLDPTTPQDPDRLPADVFEKTIPELVEAWGVDRRSDGINLVPNKDKETLAYEMSLEEPVKSGLPGTTASRETVKAALLGAYREAADGVPVSQIQHSLVAKLGHQAVLARKVVAQIEKEQGLAGNVFVHAVAYPGIHRGKTAKRIKAHIRKKKAKYVVVPEGDKRLAVWEAVGLKPVTKVPWKAALRHYGPILESSGFRVASKGSSRSRLQNAFCRGPVAVEHAVTVKPVDIRPSERVSTQDAQDSFRTSEAVPRQAIDTSSAKHAAALKKALVQVARWVQAGHITIKEARRLARSTVAPKMILRTAAMLVQASVTAPSASYKGVGNHYKSETSTMSRKAAWKDLHDAEAMQDKKARELETSRKIKLGIQLKGMVGKGLLTIGEAAKLAALDKPVAEILRLAAAASQYKRSAKMTPVEGREYNGPIVEAALIQRTEAKQFTQEERRIHKAAAKSGIKASEFTGLVKWARIQMTEGTVGKDLDQMFRLRFSSALLKASKKILKSLRATHEGLSGHVYVDAGAYLSKTGTKGCEKGALMHRTNGLKAVLEVERCTGCVFKNADDVCQKYNKPLVDSAPVNDPARFQRKAIKMADASDGEVTASLFATYDPGEYALTDSLSEIQVEEEVAVEDLGEVLWGGLHL